MKKLTILFLFALLPLMASAYDAEVNGIYYNLNADTKEAEVTSGASKYSGSVNIPASITYEGITYSVTEIGSSAFAWCSMLLTSVTIPNTVSCIGERAFYNCSMLASVNIPNSVTKIGGWAFDGCSNLTSVTIPNNVTEIGYYAFHDCTGELTVNCNIPSALSPNFGYFFNSSFSSVIIGDAVDSIGNRAFEGCERLTSVTIGNSVTKIGNGSFWGCSQLTSIKIPNSVTTIGEMAFSNCKGLKSVMIGNNVTTIGEMAFSNCKGLKSVTIPNSVTKIGNNAFEGCSGLTSVTIGNGVTWIGWSAFKGCSNMKSVTIGNSVTYIGYYAFSGCSALTEVYCHAEKVPTTGDEAFSDFSIYIDTIVIIDKPNATLHVPAASVEAYKSSPWSGFGTIEAMPEVTPVKPHCATPTITFVDGELIFDCETEGVEFNYIVTPSHFSTIGKGNKVSLPPTTYRVTVHAEKEGYLPSLLATKEIDLSGMGGKKGDVNEDGEVGMPDVMYIVNYILNGEFPK